MYEHYDFLSIYDESIIYLSQIKLLLQPEALSNCGNFIVIRILYNNDLLLLVEAKAYL